MADSAIFNSTLFQLSGRQFTKRALISGFDASAVCKRQFLKRLRVAYNAHFRKTKRPDKLESSHKPRLRRHLATKGEKMAITLSRPRPHLICFHSNRSLPSARRFACTTPLRRMPRQKITHCVQTRPCPLIHEARVMHDSYTSHDTPGTATSTIASCIQAAMPAPTISTRVRLARITIYGESKCQQCVTKSLYIRPLFLPGHNALLVTLKLHLSSQIKHNIQV